MSNDIKAGDLVQVIKPMPCCGDSRTLGKIFIAGEVVVSKWHCGYCGFASEVESPIADRHDGVFVGLERLKKIDPPAEGDSLPTRANLDQPVTA